MAENGNQLMEELEALYVRAEHWSSDYAFLEDEFRFLINLADKYFISIVLSDSERLNKLKSIAKELSRLDDEREQIASENKKHLAYLARLIKNEEAFDPEGCRERQSDIESDHIAFFKKYRSIKARLFNLSDEIFKSNGN
jgi:hypothetical protein